MHKVMSRVVNRAQHRPPDSRPPAHPGSRPAGRHGSRRPAGAPPRGPGTAAARTAVPEDGPPGGSPRPVQRRTRPQDTRPPGSRAASPATSPATAPVRDRAVRVTAPDRRATGNRQAPLLAPAAAPATTPAVRAVRAAGPVRAVPAGPGPGAGVPQPRPADLFAERLLAVLSGRSPVHSMLRHTVGQAYDELARLAERGPLRTRGARPVVRDLGWFEPRPGAVEVFARIGAGDRLRAMAFRLERGPDLRWRCTAVELGGPRPPRGNLR